MPNDKLPDKAGEPLGEGETGAGEAAGATGGEKAERSARSAGLLLVATAGVAAGVLAAILVTRLAGGLKGDASFYPSVLASVVVMLMSLAAYLVLLERSKLVVAQRSLEKLGDSNKRIRLLLAAGRKIGSTLDLSEILAEVMDFSLAVTGAGMGAIYMIEKPGDVLKVVMTRGVDERNIMFGELPLEKSMLGEVANSRRMIVIDDMRELDDRENVFFGAATPGSELIIPLTAYDKVVGVLVTATEEPYEYSAEEKRFMRGFAELAGLAISNAKLYKIARMSLDAAARQRGLTTSVLDQMVAGVMTADRKGRVAVFNKEAERLTGYAFAERTQMLLKPESSLDVNPLGPLEGGMLEGLRSPSALHEGEAFIMRKDRSLLPISYRIYPLVDEGEPLGVAAVFMEASEISKGFARAQEIDYQVLLRSLGARIERLYTHPLSRVLDRVRGMNVSEWSQSKGDIVEILEAGTAALMGLLEDVEQYLNCTTVREWDVPGECDVTKLIGDVMSEVMRDPENEGAAAVVDLEELPPVYGYERMIKTAIEEVVENAILAALEGGKKVEVVGRERDGYVRIEVADSGPGFSREDVEYMYLPFYAGWKGRSGLGLSKVSRVMRRLSGRFGPGEASGGGAIFYLEFPTAPAPSDEGGEDSAKHDGRGGNGIPGGDFKT